MIERSGAPADAPLVVGRAYDFVLWLLPCVERFPETSLFPRG